VIDLPTLLRDSKLSCITSRSLTLSFITLIFANLVSCGGGGSSSGSGAPVSTHSTTAELTLPLGSYSMESLPNGAITFASDSDVTYNGGAGTDYLLLTISNLSCNGCTVPTFNLLSITGTITSIQHIDLNSNVQMQITGLNLSAATFTQLMHSGTKLGVWQLIASNSTGLNIQNTNLHTLTISCPNSTANPANIEPSPLTTRSANTNLAAYINTCLP